MGISWQQAEYELRTGGLWAKMSHGRYWKLRQNGRVKLWKRDQWRWEIPVKAGMWAYTRLSNETKIGTFDSDYDFICSHTDPNTDPHRKAIQATGDYPKQR